VGFTKGQMIDYYTRIAPVILPHLRGRPLTFKRYPDGVEGKFFFEKNAPSSKPEWIPTVEIATPGSTKNRDSIDFAIVCDLPTLVWAANLAALELHVPMWTVGPRGGVRGADLLVFDLDPGPPASIVECCRVAALVRDALAADGLRAWAKTSGSKGMQVSASITPASDERTSAYARKLAQRLEKERPDLVVSRMAKNLRDGKVFVDWSQNNAAKTTVAPYALRARPEQWVSTPVSWDEVRAARLPADLRFRAEQTLGRVDELGDLCGPLLEPGPPPLP